MSVANTHSESHHPGNPCSPRCTGYTAGPRSLAVIAREIRKLWQPVWFGAVPYLDAMNTLDSIDENYYADSGYSIVAYFLSNAKTWKGEDARRVKAELKQLLKKAK
jgi:hypothetical protein